MKRLFSVTAFAALLSLSAAAYAGPSVGSTHYRQSSFAQAPLKAQQKPFALTGNHAQRSADHYRYETKMRRVGPHKARQMVHVRVH